MKRPAGFAGQDLFLGESRLGECSFAQDGQKTVQLRLERLNALECVLNELNR